jgi:hypothetical protein
MSANKEQQLKNWWAEGDTPVHADSRVAYAVDAHSTFLTMCRHFLMAHTYIYIAGWGMTPLMELVRGTDQRAGPDGSPQQEALLAELREEGLQEPEIDFWSTVGSANLNNRGMRDDAEMNVATLNAELARGLRMLLWAEHLELIGEESMMTVAFHLGHQRQRRSVDEEAAGLLQRLQETLGDPLVGLQLMIDRAQDNLRRFKAKQPLVGHLLPYLTGEEGKQHGLDFHEEHGWVEAL